MAFIPVLIVAAVFGFGWLVMFLWNTALVPAIALYRKIGFVEVPVDGVYARSDIKMKLSL